MSSRVATRRPVSSGVELGKIACAMALILVSVTSPSLATHPYQIKVINRPEHRHNIKDFTAEVLGVPTIDGIDALGEFATATTSRNKKAVKFDGAAIAPGEDSTVTIDLTHKVQGISPIVCDEASWSSDPMAFGVSPMIFSGAIREGEEVFPSIDVPLGEYLYLYEVQWTGAGLGPDHFEVDMPDAPSSFGILDDTWTPGSLFHTPGPITVDPMGFTIGQEWTLSPGMLPDALSGSGGVVPLAWSYVSGRMVAEFGSPLGTDDVSAVMWFTSPLPPEFGGPTLAEHNSALSNGDGALFTAAAIAPVPEPQTLHLFTVGIAAVVCTVRRSTKRHTQKWSSHVSTGILPQPLGPQ